MEHVFVTIWLGAELNVIDDVPAYVCKGCGLQYYDLDIEEKIRSLVTAGFPAHRAERLISVPVFRLDGDRTPVDRLAAARRIEESREVPQS